MCVCDAVSPPLEPEQGVSGRVSGLVGVGLQLVNNHGLESGELLWIRLIPLGEFLQG